MAAFDPVVQRISLPEQSHLIRSQRTQNHIVEEAESHGKNTKKS